MSYRLGDAKLEPAARLVTAELVKRFVDREGDARIEGDKELRAYLFGIECIILSTIATLAQHDLRAKAETISHLRGELSSFKETLAETIGQESPATKAIDDFLPMFEALFSDTASEESEN